MSTDFSGTWRSVRSEGWPELLARLNIARDRLPEGLRVTHRIVQSSPPGPTRLHVRTTNNIDETVRESTIVVGRPHRDTAAGRVFEYDTAWQQQGEAGTARLVMTRTNGEGATTREILASGEMLVIHRVESATAKTYFVRQEPAENEGGGDR